MGPRNAVLGVAGRMWSQPVEHSVELPMRPRNAVLGAEYRGRYGRREGEGGEERRGGRRRGNAGR
eukprot:5816304-Pyramimonas_sp.AAC.1